MELRTLSTIPIFGDSFFSDRFNRIDRLFSQLTGDTPVAVTPAYDLKRIGNNNYQLTLSVPGWNEKELEIETVGRNLNIKGKHKDQDNENNENWLYRGIRRTDFQLSFSLPEHTKVDNAKLENGLLRVNFYQEIPETEKPKKISISNDDQVIEHRS